MYSVLSAIRSEQNLDYNSISDYKSNFLLLNLAHNTSINYVMTRALQIMLKNKADYAKKYAQLCFKLC